MSPAGIMKWATFLSVVILVGTGVSIASADAVIYPTYPYSVCTNLSRDLSVGARGSDVEDVQRFLVSQKYPGSGSWMITGYFGQATEAAVRNYQYVRGLPQTGTVGPATRADIAAFTCSSASAVSSGIIVTPVDTGATVTTIPTYMPPVGIPTQSTGVWLTHMTPTAGAVGTEVTIFGSGFSIRNNAVRFGNGILAGIVSADGKTLSFKLPNDMTGYGYEHVSTGPYLVSVINAGGATSNNLVFTVGSGSVSQAYENYVPLFRGIHGPTSIARGVPGIWTGIVNNEFSDYFITTVNWGDGSTSAPQRIDARNSHAQNFSHTYTAPGNYDIHFSLEAPNGKKNYSMVTVTVQ